jgi:hypothetical protein
MGCALVCPGVMRDASRVVCRGAKRGVGPAFGVSEGRGG